MSRHGRTAGARRRAPHAVGIAALLAALVLSGCAGGTAAGHGEESAVQLPPLSELTPLEDPKAYVGPSTAVLAETEIVPIAENPPQQLPVTVTSHDRTIARATSR